MMTKVDLENVVSLKTYCESHDVDYPRARRMARKHTFAGAFQFVGKWVIDRNAPMPTIPTTSRRADGRQRFTVYMTGDERAAVTTIVGDTNVIDVRAMAKQRRDEKRASLDGGNETD